MPDKISRHAIARAGLRLLEVSGIEGITTRALARELGIQSPTLYWHVTSKREILRTMAAVMAADAAASLSVAVRRASWQQCLTAWAGALRREMIRYRDGARVFAGSFNADAAGFEVTETILQAMCDNGFELGDASRCVVLLRHFVVGFCIEEQALRELRSGDDSTWRERMDAETTRLPLTARALPIILDPDEDARFELGVRLMLTGMASDTSP